MKNGSTAVTAVTSIAATSSEEDCGVDPGLELPQATYAERKERSFCRTGHTALTCVCACMYVCMYSGFVIID